jgi:hypothetical protein
LFTLRSYLFPVRDACLHSTSIASMQQLQHARRHALLHLREEERASCTYLLPMAGERAWLSLWCVRQR